MHVLCRHEQKWSELRTQCSRWLGYSDEKVSPGTWNCNSMQIQKAGKWECVKNHGRHVLLCRNTLCKTVVGVTLLHLL
jgi:hypothetical protein